MQGKENTIDNTLHSKDQSMLLVAGRAKHLPLVLIVVVVFIYHRKILIVG